MEALLIVAVARDKLGYAGTKATNGHALSSLPVDDATSLSVSSFVRPRFSGETYYY